MYINRHHRFDGEDAMRALVEANALGTWVLAGQQEIVANHIPFLLERERGPHGSLVGHVARANPVWRLLDAQAPSLVIFQGPQAYITPNWYPGKAEHGKVVPTWDYAVVHAHGAARAVEDRDWLLDMLRRLGATHEAGQPRPWTLEDAPPGYIDKLLRAIVGIEIRITRLEGKLKASQDEDVQDRIGTVHGLRSLDCPNATAMAELVERGLPTKAR
ncbi:FMN-binding negative transcriptional regulator [Massilia suwonensis]|uniref:FMN-binding negative transcriptional regulator n=1 Tax=Massilia suwonensis TaxID=648895 RepID=A0ABW0MNW5_9BURK